MLNGGDGSMELDEINERLGKSKGLEFRNVLLDVLESSNVPLNENGASLNEFGMVGSMEDLNPAMYRWMNPNLTMHH